MNTIVFHARLSMIASEAIRFCFSGFMNDVVACNCGGARSGFGLSGEQTYRCGFARAIRSKKAKKFASMDIKKMLFIATTLPYRFVKL